MIHEWPAPTRLRPELLRDGARVLECQAFAMSFEAYLGCTTTLIIERLTAAGARLIDPRAKDASDTLLLPSGEAVEGLREGEAVEVFIHLDSQDRLLATMRTPKLQRGEVACLRVADLSPYGAFVDWGLSKQLLVPFAEQTHPLALDEQVFLGLILDRTGRLAGTMRIRELLDVACPFEPDDWVAGVAWREEEGIGVFVILERRYVGLLPANEPHGLRYGQSARFRIAHVHRDGKVELSLRGPAHEELADDAELLLAALSRPDAPRVGDKSSPEQIRSLFGLSKKAFKRAAGRLLKEGQVRLAEDGSLQVVPKPPSR